MAQRGEPGKRSVALAVATLLLLALMLSRWSRSAGPGAPLHRNDAGPPLAPAGSPARRPAVAYPALPAFLREARRRTAMPPPRPPVVDLAALTPADRAAGGAEPERFATNEWFTAEDLQHPELYFEMAKQMPELNRPEERRDTLAFFLAYRDKLGRDLETAGDDPGKHTAILAVIDRYDRAISDLRERIAAEVPK